MSEQGPVEEEIRYIRIDATIFDEYMRAHEHELGEIYGQNPDIMIKREPESNTIIITELPSKNRKASMIDAITKEEEE